jgi:hypothetical protein
MRLSEVADEFGNSEFNDNRGKLQHLYKVQAARCNEINIFILQLARRFPDWWRVEGHDHWEDFPTREWHDTPARQFGADLNVWRLPETGSNFEHKKIRNIFRTKYEAMVSAKREYEQAGGNYTG